MKELTNVTTNFAISEELLSDIEDGLDNIGKSLKDIFNLLRDFNVISNKTLRMINSAIDAAISSIKLTLRLSLSGIGV
ncbi:hypothetical protein PSI15_06500 [Xenorhabdus sp. PR6a]|uniref:hypothetical protein n=1 Tax=Xenorhabdus sp. PR6a TaxID=3025877 RepID=UPI0023582428|nr:hypothetical protein [Xenorhabdus sp. PR6a]MDC9581219.1 hypothetical protein [Xenorhabdus sp. PR6a]